MSEEQINQSLLDQSNALLPVLVGEAEKEKAAKKKEKDAEEKKKRVRLLSAITLECPHNELICAFFVRNPFENVKITIKIQEEAAAERKKEAMRKAAENKKLKEEADERKAEEKRRKVGSAEPTKPLNHLSYILFLVGTL
jgi:hypothetical protein